MKHVQFVQISDDGPAVWAIEGQKVVRRFLFAHNTGWECVALSRDELAEERDDIIRGGFKLINNLPFALREILCEEEFSIASLNNWYRRINEGQFEGSEDETELAASIESCFDEESIPDIRIYMEGAQ